MPGAPVFPETVHKYARFFFIEPVAESHSLLLQVSTTAGNKVNERMHGGAIREPVWFFQKLMR